MQRDVYQRAEKCALKSTFLTLRNEDSNKLWADSLPQVLWGTIFHQPLPPEPPSQIVLNKVWTFHARQYTSLLSQLCCSLPYRDRNFTDTGKKILQDSLPSLYSFLRAVHEIHHNPSFFLMTVFPVSIVFFFSQAFLSCMWLLPLNSLPSWLKTPQNSGV